MDPVQQITNHRSGSSDSPQSKTQKAFGEKLRRAAAPHGAPHGPALDSHSTTSESQHILISCPETMSTRTLPTSQAPSPQGGVYLAIQVSSENSQQRPWSNRSPASWESQSVERGCFPSKDLDGSCDAGALSTWVLGCNRSPGRDSAVSVPQDWVVRKLSQDDDGK